MFKHVIYNTWKGRQRKSSNVHSFYFTLSHWQHLPQTRSSWFYWLFLTSYNYDVTRYKDDKPLKIMLEFYFYFKPLI